VKKKEERKKKEQEKKNKQEKERRKSFQKANACLCVLLSLDFPDSLFLYSFLSLPPCLVSVPGVASVASVLKTRNAVFFFSKNFTLRRRTFAISP